ncbi:nucleoprotein [avian paramyxovirus 20]|uniref:Nucleocapsid n=1 Tax=avian paramyxovirus 20 TaxID=2560314 RepID=A0A2I6ECF3_9MONO|nr:nucleoprotein [Avian metaavulavirus 20]AUJ87602.1 nucleoprotein [Avian metaavulavirus 20]
MASVFSEYQSLQEQLVKPAPRRGDVGSTGLLRAELPVCVTLSQEPSERWNLACLNLRWLASDAATLPMKQGAILSLLSLHSDNMRAHASLAARSADASLAILEVDEVDFNNAVLRFNPRSGVSDRRAQQLLGIADDMPKTCSNSHPFVDDDTEFNEPLDLAETIERIRGVAAQVWVAAIKCMTAPDTAAESELKRLARFQQQGRLSKRVMVHSSIRTEFLRVVRSSLVIRQFMVAEFKRAASLGGETSQYYAMVGDISLYVKNSGLTAFFLTLRFGIGTHYPTLAMSVFSGELKKMAALIKLYKMKGENAAYMAFLEDSDMGNFAPANYSTLYSYAMGVGTVLEASVAKYQYAREFVSESHFRLGVETAQSQQGMLDEKVAQEMGLSEEARRHVRALVAAVDTTTPVPQQSVQPAFMNVVDKQELGGQRETRPSQDKAESRLSTKPQSSADDDATSLDW